MAGIARLLKATSRFGAEFDSLSDFLCFGVAPALVLYMWTLHDAHGIGFAPCLLFAVCSALRLARFNASLDDAPALPLTGPPPKPAYSQNFFTGVPAPAGAGLALFPLFAALTFTEWNLPPLAGAARHPAFVRRPAGGGGRADGLDPAGLELQEFQGAGGIRAAAAARRRRLCGGAADRALGGAGRWRACSMPACCSSRSAAIRG